MQHVALELGHRRDVADPLVLAEPLERAEQIAEAVAELAILVGDPGEDFLADPVVLGEIDRQRPQPQDVGAMLLHQVQRVDRIAQALGHFHALGVHREAVGQHRVIGRAAAGAAAFEQRRLEPAAVLVGAFEIEVGRPALVGPAAAFQREDMGAAAVEPDVEDVGLALVIGGVAIRAEHRGGVGVVPRIDAAGADRLDDALVDLGIDQQFAGLALDEQSDRHAPGALAADHPVGPLGDHRARAGCGPSRARTACRRSPAARAGAASGVRSIGAALIVPALLGEALAMLAGSGRSMAMNHCGVQR